MFSVKKLMDGLKKDVNELRCVEQKVSRQLELIQKPLRELGKFFKIILIGIGTKNYLSRLIFFQENNNINFHSSINVYFVYVDI